MFVQLRNLLGFPLAKLPLVQEELEFVRQVLQFIHLRGESDEGGVDLPNLRPKLREVAQLGLKDSKAAGLDFTGFVDLGDVCVNELP